MFRNNGDGTFSDRTSATRTDDPRWSTGATFFDYDRDGWLDLFVVNYVTFGRDMKRACFAASSARDYCNPSVYPPRRPASFTTKATARSPTCRRARACTRAGPRPRACWRRRGRRRLTGRVRGQ
jgi:hypothetical protein